MYDARAVVPRPCSPRVRVVPRWLVAVALVTACGHEREAPTEQRVEPAKPAAAAADPWSGRAPRDEGRAVLAEMEKFTAELCACRDPACVARANKKLDAMATARAASGAGRPVLQGADLDRSRDLAVQAQACIKNAMPPPALTDAQTYVAKNAELADRACACPDAACAEAVVAELTKWSEEFLAHPHDSSAMSHDDQERMATIERELHDCMARLRRSRQ